MTFNFDDDNLWSPMKNQREWERQLRDGEREPATLYEASLKLHRSVSELNFLILLRLRPLLRRGIKPLIKMLIRFMGWLNMRLGAL